MREILLQTQLEREIDVGTDRVVGKEKINGGSLSMSKIQTD